MSAPCDLSLHDYVRVLRRRARLVVSLCVALGALTLVLTPRARTLHEATARLKWSRMDSITGMFLEAFQWSPGDDLATQAQIIRSKPIALAAARRLGLLHPEATLDAVLADARQERVLDELLGWYEARPLDATSLIEIRTACPDAGQAVDLANALLEESIAQHTFERNRQAIEARQFVERQLEEVGARLRASEERLTQFKESHLGASRPDAKEVQFLQDEAARTESRIAALQGLATLLDQGAGPGKTPEILLVDLAEGGLAAMRDDLGRLEDRRRQLLAIQRDDSPEVRSLGEQIDRLVGRLRRETEVALDLARQRQQTLARKLAPYPRAEQTHMQLQRDVQVNAQAYEMLMRKHQEALIKEADKVQELSAVEYAARATPTRGPGRALRVMVGLLVGLLLGLVGAFVAESLDTSITRLEDVEQGLGLKVLGVVPPIELDEPRRTDGGPYPAGALRSVPPLALPVTHLVPHAPAAEAYRALRTNLEFARLGRSGRMFLFTSALPGEGKTTTVANLAVAMAQLGLRTLAWDCDLRNPALNDLFGVAREPGFTQVILGQAGLDGVLHRLGARTDGAPGRAVHPDRRFPAGLDLLTAGALPPNPSEILASPLFKSVALEIAGRYDVVLIDVPPVLPVTDAAVLAARVDGVVLVCQPGKAGRAVLRRARAHLENVGGDIRGIVLNDHAGTISSLSPELSYLYHRYDARPAPGPWKTGGPGDVADAV